MWDPLFENDQIDRSTMCPGKLKFVHSKGEHAQQDFIFSVSTVSGFLCIVPFNYAGVSSHTRLYRLLS